MRTVPALRFSRRPVRPGAWVRRLVLLGALLGAGPAAAAGDEVGRPAFRDFPPGRNNIGYLFPAVAQDEAGYIYAANQWGNFYRYDGTAWSIFPVTLESSGVREFARMAAGTLFAAGAGTVGYLRETGTGPEFVSLADRLPPALRETLDLHDALALGEDVYFAGEEAILRWHGERFTIIPCPTPPRTRGARLHRVGETIYAAVPGRGLCRVAGDRLEDVSADPVFRDRAILLLEAAADGADGLTALTATHGFFRYAGGRVTPLDAEANRHLAGKTIWRALRLRDGSLAVIFSAVSGDGGLRFDAAGRYAGVIDQTLGLYLREFRDLFEDREGGLWLGTEVGLFRLEWPSPLSIFDAVNGLGAGAVADIARHDGVLYAATGEGLFRLHPAEAAGRAAHFERLATFPAYALLAHPAGLLVAGYAELFALTPAGPAAIAALPPGGGALRRSRSAPDCVWFTGADGPQRLRPTPAGWVAEPAPGGAGRDAMTDFFRTDAAPPDDSGAGWIADATGIRRAAGIGREPQRLPHLVSAAAGAVAKLWEENRNGAAVLWVCGERGLIRVDLTQPFPPPVPYAALLAATGVKAGDRLAPDHAPLEFRYVALRHGIAGGVTYRTRLVGLENAWSEWTAERTRSFVRLPAGSYRFEVEARDADGHPGTPAALAFAVAPPWWFAPWALLGYASALAGLVVGSVHWHTRTLRRRAADLERVVAERTAELGRQNAELVRLHRLELDEKISARLAEEKARLEVLRYQLNPHFLFNTLASISAALPAGAAMPRAMVERLAEFCRLTLHRPDHRDHTTLGEELQLLRTYLQIETSRWGDLLEVALDADPGLDGERLPHFLLLPLVENALKYGRATSPDRVGVRLAARRDAADGALVVEVANTGVWIEPGATRTVSTLGIGLENLRERLRRHYPRRHALHVASAGGWVTVTLRLAPEPVV